MRSIVAHRHCPARTGLSSLAHSRPAKAGPDLRSGTARRRSASHPFHRSVLAARCVFFQNRSLGRARRHGPQRPPTGALPLARLQVLRILARLKAPARHRDRPLPVGLLTAKPDVGPRRQRGGGVVTALRAHDASINSTWIRPGLDASGFWGSAGDSSTLRSRPLERHLVVGRLLTTSPARLARPATYELHGQQ